MKHLTILVPDGQSDLNTVACIIGTFEIFTRANKIRKETGKEELFKVDVAGVSNVAEFNNGLLAVKPQVNISTINRTNLIIVPSMVCDYRSETSGNKLLMEWMTKQYKNGAEIASMCTGAYLLASSGLLDGKNCSIHWSAVDNFKTLFPKVKLKTEKSIIDENGICTNGGGYSFLNLLIYLIEKYYDRQTAIFCSKVFQIEMDRQSQSPFTMFIGQKRHGDEIIKEAQEYIESNLQEKISVEQLSSRFSVSRRNFDRRFMKATGNTPFEYSQRVKIESAKKAFETSRKAIYEVMYEVGYSDEKAFREVFRKITGISPLEYRNKYNKEALA